MNLLLLSNSTSYGGQFMGHAKDWIFNFVGPNIQKILFIPYAGVTFSYDDYTNKVGDLFREVGYQVEGIHTKPDPLAAVMEAEMIAVGGGNTFRLLEQLYDRNLVEGIRQRVEGGMPYMGWSAGSNMAGPSIRTTNDMPIVEPPSFKALNLVPFQINPHYTEATLPNHGGETRAQRLAEFLELNQEMNVVGLPEGTALQMQNNKYQLLGSNMMIFNYGKEARQIDSSDSLQDILV